MTTDEPRTTAEQRTCDCGWQDAYQRDMRQMDRMYGELQGELESLVTVLRELMAAAGQCCPCDPRIADALNHCESRLAELSGS